MNRRLTALGAAMVVVLAGGIVKAAAGADAAALAVPSNTAAPTVSGVTQRGATLTASTGTWSNNPTSYAYQWQRCNAAGTACANIPGETGPNRDIVADDVGDTLRVLVTASNADGAGSPAASPPSAVITEPVTPAVTRVPALTGEAREGGRLTVDRGEWANDPLTYAYQWQRCNASGGSCTNIPGETGPGRDVLAADVGSRLRALVTASNGAGSSSAASAASDVVVARSTAPASTAMPTITGTPQSGQTLTASTGSWSNNPTSFTYQWQRCNASGAACTDIAGATGQTRVVAADDVGSRLRVVVTARNATGSGSANSAPTDVVTTGLPDGAIRLANGKVSIPVTSVSLPERLIIDGVRFIPNPVRSRGPITVSFHVADTRGFVVRDAAVFVRSTPLVTSTPGETGTRQDGWVTFQLNPKSSFPLNGKAVQFFVRARKQGDNLLAGVSTRRLVQVRTVRG